MRTCKQCGISFTSSRKDKQYCSERCAIIFHSRSARKRKRERTVRLCIICDKRITEKNQSKFCNEECRKEQGRRKSKESARKRVRETHAKKSKKNCLSCGIVLETTVRNYHQLKRCPPCQESRKKLRANNCYEENKEEKKAYFKERHAKKMQDPEYKKKHNARSQARRDANPVIANCVICEHSFRKVRMAKTCSKECSLELRKRKDWVLCRLSARMQQGIRRVMTGIRRKDNVWKYLDFTPDELRERFTSLFYNSMSWDNMDGWHIDHIRPVSSFNFTSTDCEDFKKCWALENLQPLWAADNLSKGNKWDGEVNA